MRFVRNQRVQQQQQQMQDKINVKKLRVEAQKNRLLAFDRNMIVEHSSNTGNTDISSLSFFYYSDFGCIYHLASILSINFFLVYFLVSSALINSMVSVTACHQSSPGSSPTTDATFLQLNLIELQYIHLTFETYSYFWLIFRTSFHVALLLGCFFFVVVIFIGSLVAVLFLWKQTIIIAVQDTNR